jgi:fatty aldehyde-generating acyl-ACP reductase
MGNESSDIDFALIGHQDCWKNIKSFVDILSKNERSLPAEKISEVYSFIPPRKIFDIEIQSITGETVKGGYIETFISPDELAARYWKKNVMKVNEAADCARKLNAGVAALGGFTSIVIEGRNDRLNEGSSTNFTTGNTLTTAFIVKSLENACIRSGKKIQDQHLLIIGATGDIGSACVEYFSGKVKKLLLCARQGARLMALERKLKDKGYEAHASRYITTLLPQADLIISIASSTIQHFHSSLCKKDVIICDAGYPKNLVFNVNESLKKRLYSGGMGYVKGGYRLLPSVHQGFYEFPVKDVVHGCLLEAVILAFEKMYTPFSAGRGNISTDKIELIYSLAQKHGITEAPFFNSNNAW